MELAVSALNAEITFWDVPNTRQTGSIECRCVYRTYCVGVADLETSLNYSCNAVYQRYVNIDGVNS